MKRLGAFLIAAGLFYAAPCPLHAAPLRTLVYHFTIDSRGFNSDTSISNGEVNENQGAGSDGRTGHIKIAVIQVTPDGGMVVDATETVDESSEPPQTIRCAVYGSTTDVVCDQSVSVPDEEQTLLSYVGRFFYDPTKVDTSGHWSSTPAFKSGVKINNDYTVRKTDGTMLTVALHRIEKGLGYTSETNGTIVYDTAMEIPRSIHLDTSAVNSGNQGDMNATFTLLSDSMAAGAGKPSH